METNMDLCNIANDINNEVKDILTKYLSPYLMQMNQDRMNMKCIENILRGMPEFQRLEKENMELRRQLETKESKPVAEFVNTVKWTTCDKANYCIKHGMTMHVFAEPVPAAPVPAEPVPAEPVPAAPVPAALVPAAPVPAALVPDSIKLDIIETPIVEDNVTNELELYKAADLLHIVNNEAEASEAEADQYEEVEEDVSEVEVETEAEEEEEEAEEEAEASEAEEEEAEASEAEEEEVEEVEASEAEEEEAEQEAEASEAEEEEASEAEEEEEAEASEAEASEAEEEVSLIVINGISYYTTNETSGDIYKVEGTDDVGDQVGKFVNKVATFF